MEEFIKILELNDSDIEHYVDGKIEYLNSLSNNIEEVSLGEDGGEIYEGWINTNSSYLPSGNRSKGFKLTKQFYIDFVDYIKKRLGHSDISVIKSKINSEKVIEIINSYMTLYFGDKCNDELRKEIFDYGSLNSIGETLDIDTLKEKNVARCIEKSGGFNGIANFMGIDCSLVLSDASVENNKTGHAYCMIKENQKYKICDPNFFGVNGRGKGIPFIFDLDTNSYNDTVTFDSGKLGAIEPTVIEYDFPWEKLKTKDNVKNQEKINTNLQTENEQLKDKIELLEKQNMQLRTENLGLKERFFKIRKFIIERCSKIPFVGNWILSEMKSELGENELNSRDDHQI